MATSAVSATLGHSHESHFKGTITGYVGYINDDAWSKKVELEFEDPFGLRAGKPLLKRRRLTKTQITTQCEINGVDSTDENKRRLASNKIHTTNIATWIHEEKYGTTAKLPKSNPLKRGMFFPIVIFGLQ